MSKNGHVNIRNMMVNHWTPPKKNWQTPHGRCQKSVVLPGAVGAIQDPI